LHGMSSDRKMASWHLVMPDGRALSAGAAVPDLLRLLPGGAPLALVSTLARARRRPHTAWWPTIATGLPPGWGRSDDLLIHIGGAGRGRPDAEKGPPAQIRGGLAPV